MDRVDWDKRRASLHHVVNMSRFLIRPAYHAKILHPERLGWPCESFLEILRHGMVIVHSLLESFVDTSHYRVPVTVQRIGSTSVVPKVVADRMFSGKVRRAERIFMCIPLRRIFVGRWDFPKGVV